jgi:hypothetical protein
VGGAGIVALVVPVGLAALLPAGTAALFSALVAGFLFYAPHLVTRRGEPAVWRNPAILFIAVLTTAGAFAAFSLGFHNAWTYAALGAVAIAHLVTNVLANRGQTARGEEEIASLIRRRMPASHQDRWDVPNHDYSEATGRPRLDDHLQGLLNVLNHPDDFPIIPARYRAVLKNPANRTFFELFILLHDISKRTMEPQWRRDDAGAIVGVAYPDHERVSHDIIRGDPSLMALLDALGGRRELFLEVVRLHGAFGAPTIHLEMPSNVPSAELLPMLVAATFMDVLGIVNPTFSERAANRMVRVADAVSERLDNAPPAPPLWRTLAEWTVVPVAESWVITGVVFSLPWAFAGLLALAGADLSSPAVLIVGAMGTVVSVIIGGAAVALQIPKIHLLPWIDRDVRSGPALAHAAGMAAAALLFPLMPFAVSLVDINLYLMIGYAAGHSAFHVVHNVLNKPKNRMSVLPIPDRQRAQRYLASLVAQLPVETRLVRDGLDDGRAAAQVRREETLDGAVDRVRARAVLAAVANVRSSANDGRALATLLGRQGADPGTARAVLRFAGARPSLLSNGVRWALGTVSRWSSDRHAARGVSLAGTSPDAERNLAPSTLVAFDVGAFLAPNDDAAAEDHLLERVRQFRRHGRGDALIYLSSDGGDAARITERLQELARRHGVLADMNAYLAASRFCAFDGAAFDPRAVFERSVTSLLNVRDASLVASAMASHRLSLMTSSAGRVLLDDTAAGIEVYLIEAGLRAVPMIRALQDEMNAVRTAAVNA